jgi:hypothetical protein
MMQFINGYFSITIFIKLKKHKTIEYKSQLDYFQKNLIHKQFQNYDLLD